MYCEVLDMSILSGFTDWYLFKWKGRLYSRILKHYNRREGFNFKHRNDRWKFITMSRVDRKMRGHILRVIFLARLMHQDFCWRQKNNKNLGKWGIWTDFKVSMHWKWRDLSGFWEQARQTRDKIKVKVNVWSRRGLRELSLRFGKWESSHHSVKVMCATFC